MNNCYNAEYGIKKLNKKINFLIGKLISEEKSIKELSDKIDKLINVSSLSDDKKDYSEYIPLDKII